MEQGSFDLEEMENNLITGGAVVAIDVNSSDPSA